MPSFIPGRLQLRHIWGRIMRERLTEPIHLNFAALLVSVFGGFRSKVDFDLVLRASSA